MVSPSDAQQHPPPTDLQTDAVRLCIAFQSQLNPEFLGAATELLFCVAALSSTEFRRQSRKIIRLIETARDTLEASGISLYLFTTASCQKRKWKNVYFDLLRMLQTRRADVDDSLKARTNSLLVRLSSNFVGRQSAVAPSSSPARTLLPDKSRKSLALGITTCTPQPDTANTAASCITMPPPDAFPPRPPQSFPRRKRTSPLLPFRVPPAVTSSRKRTRRRTQQENKIPTSESSSVTYAYKLPPLTKRFGIFCTGKSSMHQYRRPQAMRAY
ncbi:hypothetical protein DFH08DRAFT_61710 [Mycena albidolilacea]|uniref:Uncharacterized protein n=1 Tax=Mycena albidolilacea TaxID=1033008 RepID=A0AAD7EVB6_9AGAR|nr:hypothetical protein DFH08DRAFT_61710 [Mycena albidolilacea]